MSFDKAVADELRGIKESIAARPSTNQEEKGYIDRAVREAVNSHIDEAIAKREKPKPTSGVF